MDMDQPLLPIILAQMEPVAVSGIGIRYITVHNADMDLQEPIVAILVMGMVQSRSPVYRVQVRVAVTEIMIRYITVQLVRPDMAEQIVRRV